jgi:hypothetical protein
MHHNSYYASKNNTKEYHMNPPPRAKYTGGRLVLEDPTAELPEGTMVEVYPVAPDFDMTDDERDALDAELSTAAEEIKQGKFATHEELVQRLAKLP